MLQSVYIKNFVLIKELNLNFEKGFSVITGETGAGKSILLGALGLVLGGRGESKLISEGADKCIIEATFQIQPYQLQAYFEEHDLEYCDECVIRRELHRSGKSRQFLNDSPVSTSVLKTLAALFIDIHSQHQNLLIKDSKFQLQVVDTYAQNAALLQQYQQAYSSYQSISRQLNETIEQAQKAASDSDYLQFQFDQLNEARLVTGELEELEAENDRLEHANEIKSQLYTIDHSLQSEQGILSVLKDASNRMASIASYSTEYEQWEKRLQEAYIELKDIAADMSNHADNIESDPALLEANRERLNTLYTLLQKHKMSSVDELIALRNQLDEQLQHIDGYDETIAQLQKEQAMWLQTANDLATQLHQKRQEAAQAITPILEDMLHQLGMQQARVQVDLQANEQLSTWGRSSVEFLYAPTKNSSLQAAGKIASGGEIARFMLCIKYLLAHSTDMPTLIFDEIDTGISGETASLMGSMLQKMGEQTQIICITHLPQIAALGSHHYFVHKNESEETSTEVKLLQGDERITAIAKMLSGTSLSEAAIENAQSLLNMRSWENLFFLNKW